MIYLWHNRLMEEKEGVVLIIIVKAIIANNNNMNYQKFQIKVTPANQYWPKFRQSRYTYATLVPWLK